MTLKLRGQIQIQDASIELSKIKDISSGKLIGRPEEASSNYDAENAAPAELSGEDIRRIAELHIDDNVHFANLESDAINAASATLAGSLSAASADLNDGALLAGTATLSGDLIASGSATAASAAFSGTLDAGASTLASATISNAFISGSMSSTGTLSSAGKATLNSLEVTNDADILGDAAITGSLSAASAGFGSGTLNAGASTLASANIAGAASAGSMSSTGTLSSAGKATLNSLEVTNDADILGATAITGSLSAASANFSSESGGGWNDPVKYDTDLTASDPASLDFFGSGVGLSSNGLVLAVGACRWEGPVNDQGGVYIYDWDSENDVWNQKGSVITADPAQDSARFGETTSLNSDGTMLAVGSQMWDGTVSDQGAAYVFERTDADSTDWTQKGSIITHSNPSQSDLHTHVSLSDDGLVLSVGVYCADMSGNSNSGAVYVYDWDASSNDWVERKYGGNIITNGDLSSGDLTGWDKLSGANTTVDYQVYDGEGTIRLVPANSTSTEGTWAAVGSDISYNFVDGQTYQLKFDVKHYTNEDRNIVYGVAKLAPGGGYNGWIEVVNMDVQAAVPGESTSGEISLSWTATSETTNGIHIRIHHGGDPLGASGAVYVNNFRITDEDGALITNSNAGIGSLTHSISGDAILSNGSFSSSQLVDTHWALGDSGAGSSAVWSSDHGGSVKLTAGSGTWGWAIQTISTDAIVSGQTYKLKIGIHDWTGGSGDGDSVKNIKYGIWPKSGTNYALSASHSGEYQDINDAISGTSGTIEFEFTANASMVSDEGFKVGIFYGGLPSTLGYVYIDNVELTDENDEAVTNAGDTSSHFFGRDTSLSSDGSVLVVGAAGYAGDTIGQGGVFTYNWNSGTNQWDQVGDVLEASSPSVNDYFGFSCQINSDATILVVSKYQLVSGGGDEGEIEIYDWNSSTSSWDFRFRIENPYGASSGTKNVTSFGYKVSIDGDGDVLVISERGTGYDNFAGRVQTYSISQSSSGGDLEAGAATLASASISGDISAANTTFSAALSAASANFGVGTLSAGASTLASLTAGAVSAGSLASSSVNIDGGYIDGTAIGESSRSSGKFSVVDITGSMTVGGDLTVSGDTTTIDTTNLIIKDPMIQMGEGNSNDTLDLGFIGQYDSNNYAGLVRDADDSGVFKLFYTDEDLSSSQTVDFDSATKATLKADIKGDIEYATSKNWSISGDIVAPNASYDGTANVVLNATIQADSVEFSMLDCKIDENDMASNSSSHIPTQSSVKAYVDTQVAAAGLNNPEPTVFLIVDSTTTFVGAKQVKESIAIDTSNVNNDYNYIDLTVAGDDQFDELSQVFLNGKKLRFSHDESTREYYFSNDDSSEYKRVHIKSEIIENGDIVEAVYFVRTSNSSNDDNSENSGTGEADSFGLTSVINEITTTSGGIHNINYGGNPTTGDWDDLNDVDGNTYIEFGPNGPTQTSGFSVDFSDGTNAASSIWKSLDLAGVSLYEVGDWELWGHASANKSYSFYSETREPDHANLGWVLIGSGNSDSTSNAYSPFGSNADYFTFDDNDTIYNSYMIRFKHTGATTEGANVRLKAFLPFSQAKDDPTYTLSATPNTIEEGNSFTVTLDTTNIVSGRRIPYTISGGLAEEDYTIGPAGLPAQGGYFEVQGDTASFTMDVISDALHGGDETVTVSLDNGLATLDIVIQNNPNND